MLKGAAAPFLLVAIDPSLFISDLFFEPTRNLSYFLHWL